MKKIARDIATAEGRGPHTWSAGLPLKGKIELLVDLMEAASELDDQKKRLSKVIDALRYLLIPDDMTSAGVESFRLTGIGTVYLSAGMRASINPENRESAYRWLEENELGELISATVNSSSLSAALKGLLEKGELAIPDEFFRLNPFTRVNIKKK